MDVGDLGEGPERGGEHELTFSHIELAVPREDQVEMPSATQ